jgi:hypothetical protein
MNQVRKDMSLLPMNIKEVLKYRSSVMSKEDIIEMMLDYVEDQEFEEVERKKQEKNADRRNDILEEQLYFARELLDEIEKELKTAKSGKQAREIFQLAVENGYFER